jgi:hypothetical protein
MAADVSLTATAGLLILVPNGIRHSQSTGALTEWDVWLGACLLNELRLSASVAAVVTLNFYCGINDSSGLIVTGGTSAFTERFRVSLATDGPSTMFGTLGGLVDPFAAGSVVGAGTLLISPQVTALRKIRATEVIGIPANGQLRFPMGGISVPTGLIITASIASITGRVQAEADFVPHVSGAYRKKMRGAVRGQATAGGAATLTDAVANWAVNQFANSTPNPTEVLITKGTGAGQTRTITSNTQNVLTVPAWTTQPDATSGYEIRTGSLQGQIPPFIAA